jgi:phage baseplate assembly protein gpV
MDRFLNVLKSQSAALDRSLAQPRFGLVASVDPARYAARVTLQPEAVLSGWLPILSPWVGNGWGLAALPTPGDQVLVVHQEGDADNGVIVGLAFSGSQPPPAASVGELWLVHATGTTIRLANDGTVRITGDLHVSGDVYDSIGPLSRLRTHYDQHTHASNGAPTSAPD